MMVASQECFEKACVIVVEWCAEEAIELVAGRQFDSLVAVNESWAKEWNEGEMAQESDWWTAMAKMQVYWNDQVIWIVDSDHSIVAMKFAAAVESPDAVDQHPPIWSSLAA